MSVIGESLSKKDGAIREGGCYYVGLLLLILIVLFCLVIWSSYMGSIDGRGSVWQHAQLAYRLRASIIILRVAPSQAT
jgi:hypothetical protein